MVLSLAKEITKTLVLAPFCKDCNFSAKLPMSGRYSPFMHVVLVAVLLFWWRLLASLINNSRQEVARHTYGAIVHLQSQGSSLSLERSGLCYI